MDEQVLSRGAGGQQEARAVVLSAEIRNTWTEAKS